MSDTKTTAPERFKCRWCSYSVMKWRTGKDGKPKSGWNALSRHIEIEHPDEAEQLLTAAGPIEPWDVSDE